MTDITLSVPDISCNHCKSSIEGALVPMEGVTKAEVDISKRSVAISFDDDALTLDTIIRTIDDQGYEVAN